MKGRGLLPLIMVAMPVAAQDQLSIETGIRTVSDDSFITGRHEFLINPNDPLQGGFILR